MIPQIPAYLQAALERQYGAEETARIIDGYTSRPVTLRVNPLKADRAEVLAALDGAGIRHEPVAWYEDAFILPDVR